MRMLFCEEPAVFGVDLRGAEGETERWEESERGDFLKNPEEPFYTPPYDCIFAGRLIQQSCDRAAALAVLRDCLSVEGRLVFLLKKRHQSGKAGEREGIPQPDEMLQILANLHFGEVSLAENRGFHCLVAQKYDRVGIYLRTAHNPGIREELSRLLHRIENDISSEENIRTLRSLCRREQVEEEYLKHFIDRAMVFADRVKRELGISYSSEDGESFGEILEENVFSNKCGSNRGNEGDGLSQVQRGESAHKTGGTRYLDPGKIAFVTCVNDEEKYAESVLYIEKLRVPEGMRAELIAVRGAPSMAAGYEEARRQSSAKYKFYLHQDALLLRKDMIYRLLNMFKGHPEAGLIGLAGCEKLPEDFVWWNGDKGKHILIAQSYDSAGTIVPRGRVPEGEVQAVDGVFMATQYDLPWRSDLLGGWHFYDISQCLEYRRAGFKVMLPEQREPWLLHLTRDRRLGADYAHWRDVCKGEYGEA